MSINPLCGANKLKRSGGAGYTTPAKTVLKYTFDGSDGSGGPYQIANYVTLRAGQTYVVDLDGVAYSTVGKFVTLDDGYETVYLGNGAVQEFEADTGEPFFVMPFEENGEQYTLIVGIYTNITVSLPEIVHTIDPKYLMPIVKLTTVATSQGAALTDEEQAAIWAATENGVFMLAGNIEAEGGTAKIKGVASVCDANGLLYCSVVVHLGAVTFQLVVSVEEGKGGSAIGGIIGA